MSKPVGKRGTCSPRILNKGASHVWITCLNVQVQRENPVFQIIYFPVHCFTIGPANKVKLSLLKQESQSSLSLVSRSSYVHRLWSYLIISKTSKFLIFPIPDMPVKSNAHFSHTLTTLVLWDAINSKLKHES